MDRWTAGLLCAAAACGVAGLVIGNERGRPGGGFLLGFFLGPVGMILAALQTYSPAREREMIRRRLILEDELRRELAGKRIPDVVKST